MNRKPHKGVRSIARFLNSVTNSPLAAGYHQHDLAQIKITVKLNPFRVTGPRRVTGLIAPWLGVLLAGACQAVIFTPPVSDEALPNPHRGFMLWGSSVLADGGLPDNHHNATLYHIYLPWRMLETADQVFDWNAVEQTYLQPILTQHSEATFVLRLVADYPDGPGSGLNAWYQGGDNDRDYPAFLNQPPLNIARNDYSACDGDGPGVAPDWNDAAFIAQAEQLIQAVAAHYDGDPRITAVQVGLLGLWGEWHQSGCPALAPGATVKAALRTQYSLSFVNTPLQTRYARDPDVAGASFGFHEDYFPSFTTDCIYGFPQCDDSGDWNLEYGYTHAVPAARENWRVNPVSGESPLTAQKNSWINDEVDVRQVLADYRFSFLGPAGAHESSGNAAAMQRIDRTLGYRLRLASVQLDDPFSAASAPIEALLFNDGSAPAYHGAQLVLDWVDSGGQTIASVTFADALVDLEPGDSRLLSVNPPSLPPSGSYSLRAWAALPGDAVRRIVLANSGRDAAGRVVLGDVQVVASDVIFQHGFEPVAPR